MGDGSPRRHLLVTASSAVESDHAPVAWKRSREFHDLARFDCRLTPYFGGHRAACVNPDVQYGQLPAAEPAGGLLHGLLEKLERRSLPFDLLDDSRLGLRCGNPCADAEERHQEQPKRVHSPSLCRVRSRLSDAHQADLSGNFNVPLERHRTMTDAGGGAIYSIRNFFGQGSNRERRETDTNRSRRSSFGRTPRPQPF